MDPQFNIPFFLAKKIEDYSFDIKAKKRYWFYATAYCINFDVEFRNSKTDENVLYCKIQNTELDKWESVNCEILIRPIIINLNVENGASKHLNPKFYEIFHKPKPQKFHIKLQIKYP